MERRLLLAVSLMVIVLIGPQFVSPSTRSPTSISGSDGSNHSSISGRNHCRAITMPRSAAS